MSGSSEIKRLQSLAESIGSLLTQTATKLAWKPQERLKGDFVMPQATPTFRTGVLIHVGPHAAACHAIPKYYRSTSSLRIDVVQNLMEQHVLAWK